MLRELDIMDNKYLKDASYFLIRAGGFIEPEMTKDDVIEALLFFALGTERILKGILFNLNPIYVYKTQDFKNTVPLLYIERLLPNYNQNKEISKSPDADVLTFKLSLMRAKSISVTSEKNTSMLFSLSNFRDIIVHNELSSLDIEKSKKLLLRDFYPLIRDFSTELDLPINYFLGPREIKLASISSEHQESIEEKLNIKLDSHRKRWEQLKNVSGFAEKMKSKTGMAYQAFRERRDKFIEITECPACNNDALLTVEVDFDYSEGQVQPMGVFVSKLNCLFCKLTIEDYDEIDHLKLNDLLIPEGDFEI